MPRTGRQTGHRTESDGNVLLKFAHLVKNLHSMAAPVTDINEPSVVHRHTMKNRHKRISGLALRAVQFPLAQKFSVFIENRDAVIAAHSFSIGHVHIAVFWIDRDSRRFEERALTRVEWFPFCRAVRRIEHSHLADLQQKLAAIMRILSLIHISEPTRQAEI